MSSVTAFPFRRVRPIMLRVVIGSVIGAAAVLIYSIITETFDQTSIDLVATAIVFTAFALFCWYDADVSSKESGTFAIVSFAVSVYLLVLGMIKIWEPTDLGAFVSGFGQWIVLGAIARFALLHSHLVLNTDARFRSPLIALITKITLLLVLTLATLLSIPVLFQPIELTETYWRVVAVIAILDVLGTVLIPLGYALFTQVTKSPGAATVPKARPGFVPSGAAYSKPDTPLSLQWPNYADGTPLPAGPDGHPDFTRVIGYENWLAGQSARSDVTSP